MVIIILGSKSDLEWGNKITFQLAKFGLKYLLHVASAHKTPLHLLQLLKKYNREDDIVYVAVAGRSNALGGFIDANSHHPVINCPPISSSFAGLDILSSLRMPSGVGCLTVLEPDAAALACAKIMVKSDKKLFEKIKKYQEDFQKKVVKDDQDLR